MSKLCQSSQSKPVCFCISVEDEQGHFRRGKIIRDFAQKKNSHWNWNLNSRFYFLFGARPKPDWFQYKNVTLWIGRARLWEQCFITCQKMSLFLQFMCAETNSFHMDNNTTESNFSQLKRVKTQKDQTERKSQSNHCEINKCKCAPTNHATLKETAEQISTFFHQRKVPIPFSKVRQITRCIDFAWTNAAMAAAADVIVVALVYG